MLVGIEKFEDVRIASEASYEECLHFGEVFGDEPSNREGDIPGFGVTSSALIGEKANEGEWRDDEYLH